MPNTRQPVLNPVLRLKKDPVPEGVPGGGKSRAGINVDRLDGQRAKLAAEFRALSASASAQPKFGDKLIVYASMFDDSFAPSWTPNDVFNQDRGARLIAPYKSGYLIEVETESLSRLAAIIPSASNVRDKVDISRIESVRFYNSNDVYGFRSLEQLWNDAPLIRGGKAFVVWLMPFKDSNSVEELLSTFIGFRDNTILVPPQLLSSVNLDEANDGENSSTHALKAIASSGDRLNLALREYRRTHKAKTIIQVTTLDALRRLAISGSVFRMEPAVKIASTSPGDGTEPNRPLPSDMSDYPIVGIVDGGLTAASYLPYEAWSAPKLAPDGHADTKHGNQIASLIVHGHDWNNNLNLAPLYCRLGVAQAIVKDNSSEYIDPQNFISYLDGIMSSNPNTRVWNFSLNQRIPCELDQVSSLGHDLALLARKHNILPIISIGNKPGDIMQPPADCEAALTVGGRLHTEDGKHAGICDVSLNGPGPSGMLKPEYSHFSTVRVVGGDVVTGSSFSTALSSPIAAHTMQRLKDPSPDLVKALLIHYAEGQGHHLHKGFGSPSNEVMPWECKPGFVTMHWKASLRSGAAFYWELPIPEELKVSGRLKGEGILTAIINPHPLVSDIAGPNYFSVRLNTALQYPTGGDDFGNLLGSLDTDRIAEQEARAEDYKWSPIRQHAKKFSVAFDGNSLKVYARIYVRDLYLYDFKNVDETPAFEVQFVLSLGNSNNENGIYDQVTSQLGVFVETAVIEVDVDVENQ